MVSVQVTITRDTDDAFPGWVAAELADAYGKRHIFNEKVPTVEKMTDSCRAEFPRKGSIRCTIVEEQPALIIIETEFPDHLNSNKGLTRFSVLPEQLDRT
jgi:hypothetical protein